MYNLRLQILLLSLIDTSLAATLVTLSSNNSPSANSSLSTVSVPSSSSRSVSAPPSSTPATVPISTKTPYTSTSSNSEAPKSAGLLSNHSSSPALSINGSDMKNQSLVNDIYLMWVFHLIYSICTTS